MSKTEPTNTLSIPIQIDVWYDLVSLLVQYNINPKVRAQVLRYLTKLNNAGTIGRSIEIATEAREYLQTIL